MIATATDYRALLEALPIGGVTFLSDVTWGEYENWLKARGENRGIRLSYDEGRLEIMSPTFEHEHISDVFPLLIFVLAQECDMKYIGARSTTLRRKARGKGKEPDDSYYFKNRQAVVGKKNIDLNIDPPPDLALEIDITHSSLNKLEIYAGLGVPELWRYRHNRMHFYRLEVDGYVEIAQSDPLQQHFGIIELFHHQLAQVAGFLGRPGPGEADALRHHR